MKKKRIALLLLLAMVVSLVGCQSNVTTTVVTTDSEVQIQTEILIPKSEFIKYRIDNGSVIDGALYSDIASKQLKTKTIDGVEYYSYSNTLRYSFADATKDRKCLASEYSIYMLAPSPEEVVKDFKIYDQNNNQVAPLSLATKAEVRLWVNDKIKLHNGTIYYDTKQRKEYVTFDMKKMHAGQEIYIYGENAINTLETDRKMMGVTVIGTEAPTATPVATPEIINTPAPTASPAPTKEPIKVTLPFGKTLKHKFGSLKVKGKMKEGKGWYLTSAIFKLKKGYSLGKHPYVKVYKNHKLVRNIKHIFNQKKKQFKFKAKGDWNFVVRAYKGKRNIVGIRCKNDIPIKKWQPVQLIV